MPSCGATTCSSSSRSPPATRAASASSPNSPSTRPTPPATGPGAPHLDEDYLILSTIHSAKGQEWKSVYLLNGIDGCIPSDLATGSPQEIEEERRLLYVAMTRAKDELDIMVPQRCYVLQQRRNGDRHLYAQRTRFIPESILANFQPRLWPPVSAATASPRPAGPRVDIASRLRRRWG